MTQAHIMQRTKRIQARQERSYHWQLIAGLVVVVVVFSLLGWMNWADIPAPK